MTETTQRGAPTAQEPPSAPAHRGMANPIAWIAAGVAILVVVVVAVAGVAYGRSAHSDPSTATITVTGSGTIQGIPDTVSFTVGVHTTEATAVNALTVNNRRMKTLEAKLKASGVPFKDQQTSGLNIYEETNQYGTVTGFSVDDTLNVTVTATGHGGATLSHIAGQAIDAAASAARNGIDFGGVSFSISNQSKDLMDARGRAMTSAMTEANQLAAGANRTVTGISRVVDLENNTPQVTPYPFQAELNATSAGVPLRVGQQPVSVQVTVVYTLS
jgi:uncharacterized protein YggE